MAHHLARRLATEFAGAVTRKHLADHAATDTMMTSQVRRAMEEQGLVRRLPHPRDRLLRRLAVAQSGTAEPVTADAPEPERP
jgi:DNA-binding MarR family transcriptional regulator